MAILYPTYQNLMQVANKDVAEGEEPVVKSRYSIVIAAAKRARQIVDGSEPRLHEPDKKPLSVAVDELYKEKVSIIPQNEENDEQ